MLKIVVPPMEQFDETKNEFITTKGCTLALEHSLVSISKWEAIYNKPFLTKEQKTYEETLKYIECMTLTQNVDPNIYYCLTTKNIEDVNKYIDSPMTATTINRRNRKSGSGEVITSELIYYWMVSLNIPFECQKWHLNRLLTLVDVCNVKNQPPKKMSKRDIMSRNSALNAQRRARLGTKG